MSYTSPNTRLRNRMAVMVKVDLCIKYNNQRFTYIKICFQGKMFFYY